MLSDPRESSGCASDEMMRMQRARYPTEPTIDAALTRRLQNRKKCDHYTSPSLAKVGVRLNAFLKSRIDGPIEVRDLRALPGGASKEQFVFELDWVRDGVARKSDRMVLRCEPDASIVETSRRREFELMQFGARLMPVPAVHWLDEEGSAMGTPFLISSFVEGVQKPSRVASNVTGMGIHFPADYRRDLAPDYLRYMATLHRTAPTETDLPSFQRPCVGTTESAELVINWWARTWVEDLYEDVPIATLTEYWLRRNAPVLDRLSVVHGDFRTGNFLFDDASRRITAVLDWELGYLGDRHADLAWVMTDLYVTREAGKPFFCGLFESENALIEGYEAAGGLSIDAQRLVWHKIFCTWKQLVLSLGCALRAGDGRTHQDVLLSWLAGCGYTLCEALRRLLLKYG
jgi:aminoglycoside phosphotransferase (APT) family kinase protein